LGFGAADVVGVVEHALVPRVDVLHLCVWGWGFRCVGVREKEIEKRESEGRGGGGRECVGVR